MKPLFYLFSLLLLLPLNGNSQLISDWQYIQIDDEKGKWGDENKPDWLRYFGLDLGDVNADGYLDVISGRYIYHNPGGNMEGNWKKITLPQNVDGILFMDVDGDAYADVIAQALPDLYWFEATDKEGTKWKGKKIGEVPATTHTNSQGFESGQLVQGGKEEFVIAGNGNIYAFEIPAQADQGNWKKTLVAANTSDEGIGLGDIDGCLLYTSRCV